MMNIIIGGDLAPTQSNIDLFSNGNIDILIGEKLKNVLHEADFRIFNLETPLSDIKEPIAKCGPNLIAPTSTIKGIKALNPSLLVLANNHIFDQNLAGLCSSQRVLKENDIPFIGAGETLSEASKPFLLEKDGLIIGVYACSEHEFGIAAPATPGANPFDPLESLDHVSALKEACDYVIVLYHGGKEHYRYPSPNLQRVCRKLVQKGADLVVCQHSHCIGCVEEYLKGTIVYGQGNFLFDDSESKYWQTGLLIKLTIQAGSNKAAYLPIVKQNNSVRLAEESASNQILEEMKARSQQILFDGFVEENYNRFANENWDFYLGALLGNSFAVKAAKKLFPRLLLSLLYSKASLLGIQNYIECEAHRELLLQGVKERMGKPV